MVKTLKTEGVDRPEVTFWRLCDGSSSSLRAAVAVATTPQATGGLVDPAKLEGTLLSKGWTGLSLKMWASGVLFISSLFIPFPAARGQPATPARIVTDYALTSTHDYPAHDPSAWRLLSSNDGGKTWAVLDVRTNEVFGGRSLRRVFAISNRTAYNTYRLQVDKASASMWIA